MRELRLKPDASNREPKLRHEFVGMMFAVAVGEVGLQTAALLQAGPIFRFLPAYTHLTLAIVVIATSWVGWTLSVAPGARRDVRGIFEWEFVVLLLDVLLVILYFILVRSVDFGKDQAVPHIAPASEVALLMLVIFALYLLWDILTKVLIFWKYRDKSKKSLRVNFDSSWWRTNGVRMLPSTACLFLSWITIRFVRSVDAPHMLTADLALIALILLFRALKDCSSSFPKLEPDGQLSPEKKVQRRRAVLWVVPCFIAVLLGILWSANSFPLPTALVGKIQPACFEQEHSSGNCSK